MDDLRAAVMMRTTCEGEPCAAVNHLAILRTVHPTAQCWWLSRESRTQDQRLSESEPESPGNAVSNGAHEGFIKFGHVNQDLCTPLSHLCFIEETIIESQDYTTTKKNKKKTSKRWRGERGQKAGEGA